jgi:hypothetical protein
MAVVASSATASTLNVAFVPAATDRSCGPAVMVGAPWPKLIE